MAAASLGVDAAGLAGPSPVGLSAVATTKRTSGAGATHAPARPAVASAGSRRTRRAACSHRHRRDLWIVALATLGALLVLACWFEALGLVGHGSTSARAG